MPATILNSGNIATGNNTPTGAPMMYAVDNPLITKDTFLNTFEAQGLGLNNTIPQYANGELDRQILAASSWVNRWCGRWFDTQTIDETQRGFSVKPYNPQLVHVVPKNRPYSKINSIYIQVLKWFVEIDVGPTGYLQDFYDIGTARIVPMLSTAGTGAGSPLPAAILDHISLGVLWVNYTFGYGTPLLAQGLNLIDGTKQYQGWLGNRLWAPLQTFNVYDSGVLLSPEEYTVDYPNGMVTLESDYTPNGAISADFTTNESLPAEIREAVILLTCHLIGQAGANSFGAASFNIQTYSISFGDKNKVEERAKQLLEPYATMRNLPQVIGL